MILKEKNIQRYAVYKYPQVRKKTAKEKKVNLKFFPEGGNLVEGIPSRVAFEATDAYGNPIALSGTVINREKKKSPPLPLYTKDVAPLCILLRTERIIRLRWS